MDREPALGLLVAVTVTVTVRILGGEGDEKRNVLRTMGCQRYED